MKSTGIVRQVDPLGRVVLPKETREILELDEGTPLEFYVEDKSILLKRYQPGCIFCDGMDDVVNFKGKNVCKQCFDDLSSIK